MKSVIDLIWPATYVALVVLGANSFPRVGSLALLLSPRDAAALLVHVEHHILDLLPAVVCKGTTLAGLTFLLVHSPSPRDVYQALDAVLADLHERAVALVTLPNTRVLGG